jgi:hypothetical protein
MVPSGDGYERRNASECRSHNATRCKEDSALSAGWTKSGYKYNPTCLTNHSHCFYSAATVYTNTAGLKVANTWNSKIHTSWWTKHISTTKGNQFMLFTATFSIHCGSCKKQLPTATKRRLKQLNKPYINAYQEPGLIIDRIQDNVRCVVTYIISYQYMEWFPVTWPTQLPHNSRDTNPLWPRALQVTCKKQARVRDIHKVKCSRD